MGSVYHAAESPGEHTMEVARFDQLSRWLAGQRSRRAAIGGALTGLALAHAGRAAAGQTPSDPERSAGEKPVFMFVQTAASGSGVVNPAAGTPIAEGQSRIGGGASYLVTLDGHSGQTIYFADRPDRPDRRAGAVPTEQFLGGLGFSPGNPPNAALVAEFKAGQGVVVLQLIEPAFDAESGQLTYGAELLQGYGGENLAPVVADELAARLPAEFGPAALFIDDCPNYSVCLMESWAMFNGKPVYIGLDTIGAIPGGPYLACFDSTTGVCAPCDATQEELRNLCNSTYPDPCMGECFPGG